MLKQTLALTLAAAATMTAPAAYAATTGKSVAVDYSDINLATEKGQRILERRLDRAARDVCGLDRRSGTRLVDPEARRCYKTAQHEVGVQFAELVSNTRRGG